MVSLTDMTFSMGALLTVAAYALTDILIIRFLIIIGSIFYIIGAFYAGLYAPGMTATIIFSCAYLIVNSYQIFRLIMNKIPVFLSDDQKSIYYNIFSSITPNEFM